MAEAEGFSYQLLSSPEPWGDCGAGYTFTPQRRLRCRRSRLYAFPWVRAWLGFAIWQDSPNLSSSTAEVSPGALSLRSSPLCLQISPRP